MLEFVIYLEAKDGEASPDIKWNSLMYLVAYLRLFGHLFMKSVVSSANASALASLSAYVTPVIFFVSVIFIRRTSTISKKNIGANDISLGDPLL